MDVASIKNSAPGSALSLRPVTTAADSQRSTNTGKDLQPDSQGESGIASEVARSRVEDAVSTIQDFVQSVRRNLDFQLDDSSGRVVVKVTDSESGDVIRQIPTEEALKLADSLDEVRSLLFKAEA